MARSPMVPEPRSLLQELGKRHGAGSPSLRAASPHQSCNPAGVWGARPQKRQPQPSSSSVSPLLCAASGGRRFKLRILLMELVLKSNPQCSCVSQARLYFTGTRRHQRERGVEAQRAWGGAAAGGWGCSCLQIWPVCLQDLLRPLQSPSPRPRLSNVAAG